MSKGKDLLYKSTLSTIYESAKIINPEFIMIDDYAIIGDYCFIHTNKFIKIGKYSHLAPYSAIVGGGEVHIKDFVEISYGVKIISGTDDIYGKYLFTPNVPRKYRNIKRSIVEIGKLSFIGANSLIYPDVRIGDGVIVNPGTIVKSNLRSWRIYEGLDCKCIGLRKYKKELINRSMEILSQEKTIL